MFRTPLLGVATALVLFAMGTLSAEPLSAEPLSAEPLSAEPLSAESLAGADQSEGGQPALNLADFVAQRGPPAGRGPGNGPGRGRGNDEDFQRDHEVFFFLLTNREKIRRTVKNLENGIETLTESDDEEVAGKIQEHVAAMYDRLEEGKPIHMRDPLFREVFSHAKKIEFKSEETEKGIRVVETSKDPYVVKLLQEHAKVVNKFIKEGHAELMKNHSVPRR